MSSRAFKRKRAEGPPGGSSFQPPPETAPSILRADQPSTARAVAFVSLLAASVGGMVLMRSAFGGTPLIGPTLGVFFLALGLSGLLYHAAIDKDVQYRRVYGLTGATLLACGVLFLLLPFRDEVGLLFLPVGVPCLLLGLLFLLAFSRNEDDKLLHTLVERALGGVGTALAVVGAIGGLVSASFFLGTGVILLLLGLFYLAGFVGLQRPGSDRGYWAGLGLGALGAVMMVIPLCRLVLPEVFDLAAWEGQPGPPVLYFYAGLEYLLLAIGICSDAKVVVLTRRELAAFFYSPIAYVVLAAAALLGWITFVQFLNVLDQAFRNPNFPDGVDEPIVLIFIFGIIPVFSVIASIIIITMRLLSEEQRTGTLEVLLTAPVNEWSVVMSKFLSALRFFLLIWIPWGLYLIALRIEGGEEFDYRPLLSFGIVLAVTGAHFVSMGLFFSGLTRNQIAAAILTFLGMIAFTLLLFFRRTFPEGSALGTVRSYISYLDLWEESLQGTLAPRFLLFHLSATVFWLFLTVKVLEARKWR
jgi:ABC-type transport system involved in multi-copper enzyme maturation permease subunit